MQTRYIVVLAISVAACATDLRSQRIPNTLTFGSALAGVLFHTATGGGSGLLLSCEGWLTALAFFFLPFALGGLGGGDVKLIAALGSWLGPADAVWLALYTGAAGGALALVVACATGCLRTAIRNIWLLLAHWRVAGISRLEEVSIAASRGPRLAYAVPILVGTVITIWPR